MSAVRAEGRDVEINDARLHYEEHGAGLPRPAAGATSTCPFWSSLATATMRSEGST